MNRKKITLLIDQDYNVLKSDEHELNGEFKVFLSKSKKCYEKMFGIEQPCYDCSIENINKNKREYELITENKTKNLLFYRKTSPIKHDNKLCYLESFELLNG